MLNIHDERRIEVNLWIVKARWVYTFGIFAIGLLTKTLSNSNVSFSAFLMAGFVLFFVFFNSYLHYCFKRIKKTESTRFLNFFSWFQIVVEICLLSVIMNRAGGVESISHIFFFLPVVSASLVFGVRGGIITAFIATVFVNLLVSFEYFSIIPHVSRYGIDTMEYKSLPITLTKTITTGIFYLVIGFFSGYSSNLLFNREEAIEEKSKQLSEKTKLLTKREKKLSEINYLLYEAKNRISAIIDNFADPLIFIDDHGKISLLNPAANEVLGLDDKNLGKKISSKADYSMENFKKIVKSEYKVKKLVDEEQGKFEEMTIKISGQERIYKVFTENVKDEDSNSYGHIKIFYDLTREKIIDKLKSEFISVAAHQLRTPLTAIKWVIKMLLDGDSGKLNSEQAELLTKGYKSNERIIDLVNDLLNVSRIEEGRFGYNFEKHNFQEILAVTLYDIEQAVKGNSQKLVVNRPDIIPDIYMDSERIIMVLQNILDNAIKYTPINGKIEINISLDDKNLKVSVKDSGVGVPKKDQKKIFSKFFRATNVVRMETEGTGLGLFIAKNVVERHGGKIYIDSEEGVGTEVSFVLPLNLTKKDLDKNAFV